MEGHHQQHQHHHLLQQQLHHHQQQQQQQQQHINVDADRFPQWSVQETKEFLIIRAELDRSFMETKRNKLLWEVISTRMREKGYNRSAEQCKCKWKNLVTRYKGCETMETESMRQQFPFYNELQAIFSARNMQNILWPSEGDSLGQSKKNKAVQQISDEEDNLDMEENESSINRKKKKGKTGASGSNNNNNDIKEILEDFMRQQMQMEMQWRKAYEAREKERRLKEMEWRRTMEALENERLMMDRRWREREEQRRNREEARAEKRDALITALLNKLRREDHQFSN